MKNIQYIKKQKGFALLFTVLISSVIISIGATIISISIRQTILSTTSRESQHAFYVANTGLECAFYWDVVKGLPPNEKVFPVGATENLIVDKTNIKCAGGNITSGNGFEGTFADGGWDRVVTNQNNKTTTFRIVLEENSGPNLPGAVTKCAVVTVTKELITSNLPSTPEDDTGSVKTKIESKGYNTCDLTSPRAVERGIKLEYKN